MEAIVYQPLGNVLRLNISCALYQAQVWDFTPSCHEGPIDVI